MDRVHEGVHKPGPQAWSMFCIRWLARVEQGGGSSRGQNTILPLVVSFSEKISH